MKFAIPEISWHNRDPVLSVDFQPKSETDGPMRLASGGTDSHVLIWYISASENGSVNLEVAADLTRHQKAVNVVRWSPNGQYLGSGDDESIIFIWKQKTEEPPVANLEGEEQYKESWVIYKTLRGHMEDVMDISWSSNSLHLASGSVDNKLIVWDINRGRYNTILSDHKGFVQGVSWDPKGQIIASSSSDRVFRTFDVTTKKVISRSSKATLPFPSDHPFHEVKVRLFHDDTLQTYYRRLHFSPDGMLIAVPTGRIEPEQGKLDVKPIDVVYIYTRYNLKVPVCILPSGEPALVTRWSPRLYALRSNGPTPAFPMEHRMILAVATKRSVMLYDTQQKTPIALISNIHYTRLTDLSWSPDGRTLVASSTDGFCSVIMFSDEELGDVLPDELPDTQEQMDVQPEEPNTSTAKTSDSEMEKPEEVLPSTPDKKASKAKGKKATKPATPTSSKMDTYIKFKTPTEKSPKKQKVVTVTQKTPVKSDLLEESAMPSWNDNSSSDIIKPKPQDSEPMIIDDSEDIQLVYEDTQSQPAQNAVTVVTIDSKHDEDQAPAETPPASDNTKSTLPSCSKTSEDNFLKQAKVTDIKEPVFVKTVQSPKAPRRVNFVTLSSPKNSKKK